MYVLINNKSTNEIYLSIFLQHHNSASLYKTPGSPNVAGAFITKIRKTRIRMPLLYVFSTIATPFIGSRPFETALHDVPR
jgi:hypothetical protein